MILLHIVVDSCPPDRLDRALLYLQRVKAPTVDIAAGAELLKGMQFAERVRRDVPGIKIFWRNLEIEDTGIHTKMTAAAVYQKKVVPHLAWFKRNEIVFMPDNESSGNDDAIKRYVQWQVEMAVLLHTDNLRGAFCRFSSGTIDDGGKGSNQYPLLKPIFSAMIPGDYVSPNEYSGQPGVSSGGHIERYKLMWKAAGYELPTVIGEAGVAMNYDPGKGYIDAGMTDEAYGQQMLDEEIWYLKGKIDRHIYLVGGFTHEGYRLRDGVLSYWEKHYAKNPPVVITPPPAPAPPTIPLPGNIGSAETIMLTGAISFPLQATPNIATSQNVGTLLNAEQVRIYRKSKTFADALDWYWTVRTNTPANQSAFGWVAITLPPIVITPPPSGSNAEGILKQVAGKASMIETLEDEIEVLKREIKELLSNWYTSMAA